MASTEWGRYGIRPSGDPKTRSYVVTRSAGVTVGGRHYAKGETMPRRQGENVRFGVDRSEWSSWDEWQRARAGQGRFRDYPKWVELTAQERDRKQSAVRNDPDFNRAYLRWQRAGRPRTKHPRGKLANLLVAAGLRPASAKYPVGASPGYRGRAHRRAA